MCGSDASFARGTREGWVCPYGCIGSIPWGVVTEASIFTVLYLLVVLIGAWLDFCRLDYIGDDVALVGGGLEVRGVDVSFFIASYLSYVFRFILSQDGRLALLLLRVLLEGLSRILYALFRVLRFLRSSRFSVFYR